MTALAIAMLLSACAVAQDMEAPAETCGPGRAPWRQIATDDDRDRLRRWRDAWGDALGEANRAGHGAEIAAEGALLEPDAALPGPPPPPGDYRCRTIKLGSRGGTIAYLAYPSFRCRMSRDGGTLRLVKLSGSQRPIGRLYPDRDRRLIFLGTLQLGDETRAFGYGVDRERDLIGVVERVAENRWRLVLPYPHFESLLDVVELVPERP